MVGRIGLLVVCVTLWTAGLGCDVDNLLNQTASFGGDTAGQRGQFSYVVINNTPYRAVFTSGAYDDLDQNTVPQFQQFGNTTGENPLDPDSSTIVLTPNCARVLAIGTPELIGVIEENAADRVTQPAALIQDVYLIDAELDEPIDASTIVGVAPGIELRLGADFPCGGLVIFRIEIDDTSSNGFRIDYEVTRLVEE